MNGPKDYCVFSIDGLEDTNHLYRRNVKWEKVIENARSFITAGGKAHWDMLVFEHNKHQVDEAKSYANKLGFVWFRSKCAPEEKYSRWGAHTQKDGSTTTVIAILCRTTEFRNSDDNDNNEYEEDVSTSSYEGDV